LTQDSMCCISKLPRLRSLSAQTQYIFTPPNNVHHRKAFSVKDRGKGNVGTNYKTTDLNECGIDCSVNFI